MYFNYEHVWAGGHGNTAVDRTAAERYLAEGSTRHGVETYLCILNPLDVDQAVAVEYLVEEGGGKRVESAVPARSRCTRNVDADVGENHDIPMRLEAREGASLEEPGEIVVERPVYSLYGGALPGGQVASGFPAFWRASSAPGALPPRSQPPRRRVATPVDMG